MKVVGAVRLFHLSRELQAAGHTAVVVTCRNRRFFHSDPGLQPVAREISAVPAWDWRSLRLRLAGSGSAVVRHGVKETFWGRWLARAQDSFPLSLLLGDGGPVYILLAYRRACRLVRQYDVDYLFTSYRPFADHWAAYLVKRRFPHLRWIADFRDLHVDPTRRNVLWPRLQTRIDRRMLRRASLVTTVSQGLADHLPAGPEQLHILRNAIPSDLPKRQARPTERFAIVYTGALYPGLQDAGLLFQALTGLLAGGQLNKDHLELIYLGKDGDVWDAWIQLYGLSAHSRNRREISRQSALAQQGEAGVNLLLSWSSPQLKGVLTSKIYEYLSAGVPILAIVNGPRDAELEELTEGTGGGRVFYNRPDQLPEISAFLLACYEEWKENGLVESEADPQKLKAYTWREQMERFLEALGMIC